MTSIQTDLSEQALTRSIRANLNEFFRHLGKSVPEGYFENGKFTRWYSSLRHPWFNGVLSSSPPEDDDDAFVEETIGYFRSKNVDTFTWWLEPPLKPADWKPVLSRHGLGFSKGPPGMAVDLETLSKPVPLVDGLEIRAVEDDLSLHTWAHSFMLGYSLPPEWEASVYAVWQKLGLAFPIRNYLGYWNGEPIGTSSIFYGAGVAGIYCVSTLPAARGKGIGAAMTLHPLYEARNLGYRIGILQSSEMGFNVYKRIGFRHLSQVEHFYLNLH